VAGKSVSASLLAPPRTRRGWTAAQRVGGAVRTATQQTEIPGNVEASATSGRGGIGFDGLGIGFLQPTAKVTDNISYGDNACRFAIPNEGDVPESSN